MKLIFIDFVNLIIEYKIIENEKFNYKLLEI